MSQTIAMSMRDFDAIRAARKAQAVEPIAVTHTTESANRDARKALDKLVRLFDADPSSVTEQLDAFIAEHRTDLWWIIDGPAVVRAKATREGTDCASERLAAARETFEASVAAALDAGIAAQQLVNTMRGYVRDAAREAKSASKATQAQALAAAVSGTVRAGYAAGEYTCDPDALCDLARECRHTGFGLDVLGVGPTHVDPALCRALAGVLGSVGPLATVTVQHRAGRGDQRIVLAWDACSGTGVECGRGRMVLAIGNTTGAGLPCVACWDATVRVAA